MEAMNYITGKKKVKWKCKSKFKNKIIESHRNKDHKLCVMRRKKSTRTVKEKIINTE